MEDGTYEVTYVANAAGVYELSVLCRDDHAADSPYPVRVLPGPAVFARTLVSGVKSAMRPGDTMEFEIEARDRFGNRCTSDPDADGPLEVLLDGSGYGVKVVRAGDGRMVVRITIEEDAPAGRKVMSVLLGGRDVPGTPFSIECGIEPGNGRSPQRTCAGGTNGVGESDGYDEGGCSDQGPHPPEGGNGGARRVERSKWDAFVFEDDDDGWDSGPGEDDGGADRGDKVPVVENLEDLWLVSKLQQERKAKEALEKKSRMEAMRRTLEASFGKDSDDAEDKAADFRAFLDTYVGNGVGDDGIGGDKVGGDKVGGDKIGGDKVGGDKIGGDKVGGDKIGGDLRARSLTRAAGALDDV